jgi:hypothetical protein
MIIWEVLKATLPLHAAYATTFNGYQGLALQRIGPEFPWNLRTYCRPRCGAKPSHLNTFRHLDNRSGASSPLSHRRAALEVFGLAALEVFGLAAVFFTRWPDAMG